MKLGREEMNVIQLYRNMLDDKKFIKKSNSNSYTFAFLGGIFLGLSIYIVYAMVMFEEVYKFILGARRYRQKKWLKNIVDN